MIVETDISWWEADSSEHFFFSAEFDIKMKKKSHINTHLS